MFEWTSRAGWLVLLAACSGPNTEEDARTVSPSGAAPEAAVAPALGSTPANPAQQDPAIAVFVDPESGQALRDVRDADREIVRFDIVRQAMIWVASGNPVGGWTTTGNDLHWQRSGGAFRVRFGSEGGERRAYFTETDSGTICNLAISAPEQLSISPTNETPPGS